MLRDHDSVILLRAFGQRWDGLRLGRASVMSATRYPLTSTRLSPGSGRRGDRRRQGRTGRGRGDARRTDGPHGPGLRCGTTTPSRWPGGHTRYRRPRACRVRVRRHGIDWRGVTRALGLVPGGAVGDGAPSRGPTRIGAVAGIGPFDRERRVAARADVGLGRRGAGGPVGAQIGGPALSGRRRHTPCVT